MARGLREIIARRVWEPLWLARAEESARGYTPEQHERARRFARAAKIRLRAGQEHRHDESLIVGLSLYRDAARLALTGLRTARGTHDSDATLTAEQAVVALEQPGLPASASDLERLKSLLSESDPLALDRLPHPERRELALAAERAVRELLAGYEIRTLPELRLQRVIRASAALAGIAGLILAVLAAFSIAGAPEEANGSQQARSAPSKASKANRVRKH